MLPRLPLTDPTRGLKINRALADALAELQSLRRTAAAAVASNEPLCHAAEGTPRQQQPAAGRQPVAAIVSNQSTAALVPAHHPPVPSELDIAVARCSSSVPVAFAQACERVSNLFHTIDGNVVDWVGTNCVPVLAGLRRYRSNVNVARKACTLLSHMATSAGAADAIVARGGLAEVIT